MKIIPKDEKDFEEWKRNQNKEAYKISQLTSEERKKYYKLLPPKTEEQKQLDNKFKAFLEREENHTTSLLKWVTLIVSIIMGILFFNGSVPFLFFIFPLIGFCYMAFN